MSQVQQHLEQGDFQEALRALEAELRARPTPDLLLMAFNLRTRVEQYDAALAALEELVRLEPGLSGGAAFLRDCAEAERMRTLRRTDAASAGQRAALQPPPPFSRAYAQAAVLHAKGQHAEASRVLAEAARLAPALSGTLTRTNGTQVPFSNLTDSDDLTGPHLPYFEGSTVMDVPYCELRSVRFAPPRSSMDFTWVHALLETRAGERLEVRVPSLYSGSGLHEDGPVRLGEMTVWSHDHDYAEGAGQRDLKLTTGDGNMGMVGLLQVAQIVFEEPARARTEDAAEKKEKGFWSRLFN